MVPDMRKGFHFLFNWPISRLSLKKFSLAALLCVTLLDDILAVAARKQAFEP